MPISPPCSPNPEKVRRIVNEAREHFGRYGFAKTTMDDIAAGLGIVKGALYYYFPTKESLFKAVIVEDQHAFTRTVEAMLGTSVAPQEKLCRYARMRMQFFRTMVNFSYQDEHSWGHISATMKEVFQEFEQTELRYVERIMDEGKKAGTFDLGRKPRAAELLLHLLQGLRLRVLPRHVHGQLDEAAYQAIEGEVQLFLDIFLFGVVRRTPAPQTHRMKNERTTNG